MNRQIRVIVLFTLLGAALGAGFTYWMMSDNGLSQESAGQSNLASTEKDREQPESSALSAPISEPLVTSLSEAIIDRSSDADDASDTDVELNTETQPRLSAAEFHQFLATNCDANQKINIATLPFLFGPDLRIKYSADEHLECRDSLEASINDLPQQGGYVVKTIKLSENGAGSTVKIGTKGSDDANFSPGNIANYFGGELGRLYRRLDTVEAAESYVHLFLPGPYGLSSMGIPFEVVGFKEVEGYLIVSENFVVIPVVGRIRALFEKYQDESSLEEIQEDGLPLITANSRSSEFLDEFVQTYFADYPIIEEPYKGMVDSVLADLSGVGLK